jgi:hypothetical protein
MEHRVSVRALKRRLVPLAPLLAAGLAGCQSQARRLLLLDEALSPSTELVATATPWRLAGYHVEYRRYYPHLTRADLERYRTVMVLGGPRPENGSDALDAGDLALLTEWTLRGGVVVLGYPTEGEGSFARWVMNRWLAWSGAGITIGDFALRDAVDPTARPRATAVQNTGLRGIGFNTFPAGVNNLLLVDNGAATLARAGPDAFEQPPGLRSTARSDAPLVAASRVASGLVIVLSRSALEATGQEDSATETRSFLVSLARWSRRPAEWARIPAAGPRARLQLEGGQLPVLARSPRAVPPTGATVERLERRDAPPRPHSVAAAPTWLQRQGVRALVGDFPALAAATPPLARLTALDSLIRLLDGGGLNLLVTDAHAGPIADSAKTSRWERDALRAGWQQVAGRLQATSVRWLPLVGPRSFAPDTAAESCPLDPLLWTRLASGIRVLARFAATRTDLIPAVGISLDASTESWSAPPFCDAAWLAGLEAMSRDSSRTDARLIRLTQVPRPARYDSLLEGGLLAAYDSAVARVAAQRGASLRADVRRQRRGLLLAVVVYRSPADWFTRSLVQGMSTPGTPALVFSSDPGGRVLLDSGDSSSVLHVLRLEAPVVFAGDAVRLSRAVFRANDGFWLGPSEVLLAGPSDSLARLVRRLGKDR